MSESHICFIKGWVSAMQIDSVTVTVPDVLFVKKEQV